MLELAQKQTKAQLIKNKFSITNIEESMGDLLGTLSKTAKAVSDYSDSDDDDDDSQGISIVVTDSPPDTTPTQPSTPDVLGLNTTNNDPSNNDLSNNDLNIV